MTDMTVFQQKMTDLLPDLELRFEEPMAKHTSFRIGGPVEVMAFPKNAGELANILKMSTLLDVQPVILGAGTNILAPDEGLEGIVVCLKDGMRSMERLSETEIYIGSGVSMTVKGSDLDELDTERYSDDGQAGKKTYNPIIQGHQESSQDHPQNVS